MITDEMQAAFDNLDVDVDIVPDFKVTGECDYCGKVGETDLLYSSPNGFAVAYLACGHESDSSNGKTKFIDSKTKEELE